MLHSEYLPPLTLWQPETLGVLSHIYTYIRKNTFCIYAIIWYYYENIYYLSVNYIYFVTTRKAYFGYSVKHY